MVTPVHVYTSGDEGELFLNGRWLGRRTRGTGDYRLRWDDVVYEAGTLKVQTYRKGEPWAADEVRTTGAAAQIGMTADRTSITADGRDRVFITAAIQDGAGLTVPRAANRVTFTIDGPGHIVATDNGDPTSMVAFTSPSREAFNGLALAIVGATRGASGTIRVTATGERLRSATISIAVGR